MLSFYKGLSTLAVVFLLSANISIFHVLLHFNASDAQKSKEMFTYIGESYPMVWDIPGRSNPVEMTFSESDAYVVDGPFADALWTSNCFLTTHMGYVRLGLEKRAFALAMFHQLHCVNTFRRAIVDPDNRQWDTGHVQHCLSYLRQFFVCAADDTLEPDNFADRDFEIQKVGHTRVCKDWSAVYQAAEANWDEWIDFFWANATHNE